MTEQNDGVVGVEGPLAMEGVERIFEMNLIRRADTVRVMLCFFLLVLVLAAPKSLVTNTLATNGALALAAAFTIWTLFLMNWKALWEQARLPLAAVIVVLIDVAWLSLFILGTGGFHSPFESLLLLIILFAAVLFGSLPAALPLATGIVIFVHGGFAAAVIAEPAIGWQLSGRIIGVIAVAWLAYGLASVLERERRANESVVRNLTEGVLLIDSDQTIVLANPQIETVCRLPIDTVVGKNAKHIPQQPAYEHLATLLADIEASGSQAPLVSRDITIELPDPVDFRVLTVRLGGTADRPLGWVVISQDITEMKVFARMTADGIAVLSHELRSPLATLRAVSQVLSSLTDTMGPEQRGRCIWTIERSTDRLLNLVSKLMDLSALEQGNYELKREPVQAEKLLEDIAGVFKMRARLRDTSFATNCAPDLPDISGDTERLEQLFSNLCENALKYTAEGGHVELAATQVNSYVEIAVSDDGCGIPAEQIENIFDKFAQGDEIADVELVDRGMGLGLYLARTIARLHGGDISVESAPGEGSTFRVKLPIAQSEA